MSRVAPMDDREGVPGRAMFLEAINAPQDSVEYRLVLFISAETVVKPARAIHADAHQEFLLRQECRPGVIKQDAVRLEAIVDSLAVGVLALQRDCLAEELHPHECWLSALPGKGDIFRDLVG